MELLTIRDVQELTKLGRSTVYKLLPALDTIQLGKGCRITQESLDRLLNRALAIGLWPAVAEASSGQAPPDTTPRTTGTPAPLPEPPVRPIKPPSPKARNTSTGSLHLVPRVPAKRRRKDD